MFIIDVLICRQLESMMNAFESKWNERLLSMKTSSPTNVNLDKVIPVLKDLTSVCQQFNQQNVQMQQQLNNIVTEVQNMHSNMNKEHQK